MARARNLKPSFFRDAALVELPVETRLLFAGLWTLADRKGRLEDKPKQIKMELYPADSFDVDVMLSALHDAELIIRYEVEGKRFIQVRSFEKHQNPHRDEKESAIPAPCEHGASTVQAPCEHDGNRASTSNLQPISFNLSPESTLTPSAASPSEASPQEFIFTLGRKLLGDKAGSLIGKARKTLGDEKVTEVLACMSAMSPPVSDPIPYFVKATTPKPRRVAA